MNYYLSLLKKVTIRTKVIAAVVVASVAVIFVLTFYSVTTQNNSSVKTTSYDAVITAKTMLSGLNAMMLNGTITNKNDRTQLFNIYRKIKGIKYFKIVRGDSVNKEFGAGLPQESPTTDFDNEVLNSKKEIKEVFINKKTGVKYLRVGVPFVAEKMSRGIDCLTCHTVQSGTTLGGVVLVYSLKKTTASSYMFMRNISILSAILVILLIIIMYLLLRFAFIVPLKVFNERVRDISKGEGDLSKLIPLDSMDKPAIVARRHRNCMLNTDELGQRCWDTQIERYKDKGEDICKKCSVYKNSIYDEITTVVNEFNKFMLDVREIVKLITEEAMTIVDVSTTIETSVGDISGKAKEQAEHSTQVAAASEEMSQTIKEISRNTQNLSNVAKDAADSARDGFDIVEKSITEIKNVAVLSEQLGTLINGLEKSSYEIGEIISVINDIADQTNLLALNAAIEAARAGESGRGFAVVADEVRKLAERTMKATKEIVSKVQTIQQNTKNTKSSMDSTMKEVDVSVQYASKAGESLHNIEKSITSLAEQIDSIAAASEEQTAATNEISNNIEMVSDLANSNSQMSADAEKTASSIYGELEKLIGILKRFKY